MLSLTVVVPAYNEEKRVVPFLKELLDFKRQNSYFKELIYVNDGSTDRTLEILEKYKPGIKIVSYAKNQGKGYAVKTGMLAATQETIVFLDTDGSTHADQLPKMVKALEKFPLVFGTRKSKESEIVHKQPPSRIFASWAFNTMSRVLFSTGVNDALCGFKGFRKKEGKAIANKLISRRWIFDVEMAARARRMGYGIGFVPIRWEHFDDAKMSLGMTSVNMVKDLLKLKLALMKEK